MSHYAYIIADSADDAEDVLHSWILGSPEERRIQESWSICFKGEPDARALLEKHKDTEPDATVWRVSIVIAPVDVPRETSQGES